jgi:hypothetical protein
MNITEVSGQKAIPVIVQRVEPSDFKGITKKQFFFRWDQLKGEADIYKLTFTDSPEILGLMGLIDLPSEYRIEIKLLAVSKENMGSGKQYEGIAGCLIAYTAREALKKYGGLAAVSLKPKTEIRQHYINKYGMKPAGQQVYLDGQALFDLINIYEI